MTDEIHLHVDNATPLEPGRAYVIQLWNDATPEIASALADWGRDNGVRFLLLGPAATLVDPQEVAE